MRVLIVGGGGREHALAWKAAQSGQVTRVFCAPGNAGTAGEPKVENVACSAEDVQGLVVIARQYRVDLTVVGPEAPLVAGIVDAFDAEGLACFGPSRAAAQLEGSKAYAKAFLDRHGIPTARYGTFDEAAAAERFLATLSPPWVIKADGLAAGKGVVITHDLEEARRTCHAMLSGHAHGAAGTRVVVEEYLHGEEASFIVVADGEQYLPLVASQDHKARDDGDQGPNTGGMGAYSPAPVVTSVIHERVLCEIIEPTLRGMAADGIPYRGFLYAGLMIGTDGTPRVLEYNCRLGDPEAQPILMRLRSDLVALCQAGLQGKLFEVGAEWDPRTALGVVLAAGGYPGDYRKGDAIDGLDDGDPPDTKVFHAGTASHQGRVVTAGGRVLCVCALGTTVREAQRLAYKRVRGIHWEGVHYRTDIGQRAIARETNGN